VGRLGDERGAVFAEYAVVLIAVALIVAIAVAALGVPLFNLYAFAEATMGLPIP
jgi:Flp pilus assembly pilin Flp